MLACTCANASYAPDASVRPAEKISQRFCSRAAAAADFGAAAAPGPGSAGFTESIACGTTQFRQQPAGAEISGDTTTCNVRGAVNRKFPSAQA